MNGVVTLHVLHKVNGVVTLHAQHKRGKVIWLWTKKNRTLAGDSPFQHSLPLLSPESLSLLSKLRI